MATASVFICHAFPDDAFARDLALALETFRLSVWRDQRKLRGGERLTTDVRWAIEQARQVIVVVGLNTGDPAWLRREIEVAQDVERHRADTYRVIPLLLPGVDHAALVAWFASPPRIAPIRLTEGGLGAALPKLLVALGESLPTEPASERNPPRLADLELVFLPDAVEPAGRWRVTARLNRGLETKPAAEVTTVIGPLPLPPAARALHGYWQDLPIWPIDAVRQVARQTDAWLAAWGQVLHRITLGAPDLEGLITAWRDASGEHRLTVQAAATSPAVDVFALPWELLHDGASFLSHGKQPVQIRRRLPGSGDPFPPAPPPLRILTISPRPDTEPTGHADYRRSALPLAEALDALGDLVERAALMPPSLATLEKQLNDAWAAGRPFTALHLDGYLYADPDSEDLRFGFEAAGNALAPTCRDAHFVATSTLAALLVTYHLRLVVITGTGSAAVRLAALLLTAGIAAVLTVHPDAPAETLRRFWNAFYEELLRGARIGQALSAGQRRLTSDSYRVPGLGGGGVHVQDGFISALYLGERDPRLMLRPPLELWRRLINQPRSSSLGLLPEAPATGFIGRSRDLLRLERLLEDRTTVFLRGAGGSGKTTTAAALARWLEGNRRFHRIAYVHAGDAGELNVLLEVLGRQLLTDTGYWSVERYPTGWQALDDLRQTLRAQPVLVVLDQLEQWPAEHDELFDQFWKQWLDDWPGLRLLGLGRLGPPPFAQPWTEIKLGPLDENDAVALLSQTLLVTREAPPAADSGTGFQPLCELAALAGGHPGALRWLAHELGERGVKATLALLRPLHSELLCRHGDDSQWPLYLRLELILRRLPDLDRERLVVLAFFRQGVNRLALSYALGMDAPAIDALADRLIGLGLVEDRGYGHLRFDSALAHHLAKALEPDQQAVWRDRWRTGMTRFLAVIYPQYFKDGARTSRLLRLELPNLLALLRDSQQTAAPEVLARLAGQLEQLLAGLGVPAALAEVVAARERAGLALQDWSRARFENERLRIERLREAGSLEDALQSARQLQRRCQVAEADAYRGAAYDLARAGFELGKLLKLAGAAEPAARELETARQQFQTLADAGNVNAGRMAAVAGAEIGDCLSYLRRLQEAAAAYETALVQADPKAISPAIAANKMQLGLVRQRQGDYAEAALLYEAARQAFDKLGEPEGAAQAWRQLSVARKLDGQMETALAAAQQALYLYEQQRNRAGIAEVLGELGHLHQVLNQLEQSVLAYRRMAELYQQLGDGRGEETSRNRLANVLIQLQRPDEARQELYRASECNLPESPTARNWAIRRGLRDVSQTVQNPSVADQARQQAIQKYLAYRRVGGENANAGAKLCTQIGQAIRAGDTEAMITKMAQILASPNIPDDGKQLIKKLQAILAGERNLTLAMDPNLHYQYAVEIQLLIEDLTRSASG
ncbi:MAG: TIR domain-containing protein [Candidatus Competibacteraceae bacterium]